MDDNERIVDADWPLWVKASADFERHTRLWNDFAAYREDLRALLKAGHAIAPERESALAELRAAKEAARLDWESDLHALAQRYRALTWYVSPQGWRVAWSQNGIYAWARTPYDVIALSDLLEEAGEPELA